MVENNQVIKLQNVAFGYSRTPVIEHVTMTLNSGDGIALIGPNGSGKTTFLRGLLGMVQLIDGTMKINASTIGYVPQSSLLDPTFPVTAQKVVEMGLYRHLRWYQRLGNTEHQKVAQSLQTVGMQEFAGKQFGSLSGGQRQRVLVARAIVADPQLLLLDEPFNGLDEPNRNKLLEIIHDLRIAGVAVAASTHDFELAYETCNKAALFSQSSVSFGDLPNLLSQENLTATYGGSSIEIMHPHHEPIN